MYTRAISTLGCAEADLPAIAALVRRHGLDAVELRALGGDLNLPARLEQAFGRPPDFARACDAEGLRIQVVDTSFKLAGSPDEDRDALRAHAAWADAVGARWLRVFDGWAGSEEASLVRARETLEWWSRQRSEHGFRAGLAVETHDWLFTGATVLRLAAACPGEQLEILWDTHHTWKRGGEDPVQTWRMIRDRVVHVHVKDSVSRPSARHPFTYVLPGRGEFPFAAVRRVLADEYAGAVTLEWERLWHPYLPPLDDALSAASSAGWW